MTTPDFEHPSAPFDTVDEAIADMLAGDPEIDVELDDELDVDGALSLWYGFRALLQSVQE